MFVNDLGLSPVMDGHLHCLLFPAFFAAMAAGEPSRLCSTQPSRFRWGATLIANAPGSTLRRTTAPAAV